jgi:hypothetical protein
MSPLASLLEDVAGIIVGNGKQFALVGGLAVSVRAEPRFTRDIDLAVAVVDDGEAESLVRSMTPRFQVLSILEHDPLDRLATVRLGVSGSTGEPVVDLLFASSCIEAEVVAAATAIEVFPEVTVPVARTGHLLAMKLLARDERRPQDDLDLQVLLGVAKPDEVALATEAIDLIVKRGAHRDRDLAAEWQQMLAQQL